MQDCLKETCRVACKKHEGLPAEGKGLKIEEEGTQYSVICKGVIAGQAVSFH